MPEQVEETDGASVGTGMITKKFTRRPSKFGMPEISASEAPIGYRSCVVLPVYRPSLVRVILLLNSKIVVN